MLQFENYCIFETLTMYLIYALLKDNTNMNFQT